MISMSWEAGKFECNLTILCGRLESDYLPCSSVVFMNEIWTGRLEALLKIGEERGR
jgi:hypothetical protein